MKSLSKEIEDAKNDIIEMKNTVTEIKNQKESQQIK